MIISANVHSVKNRRNSLVGHANVTIEDPSSKFSFCIRGIQIMEVKGDNFITFPAKKQKEEYIDICFPLNQDTRDNISKVVLEEYSRKYKNN